MQCKTKIYLILIIKLKFILKDYNMLDDLKFDPENNEFLQGKIEMAKKVVERMDGKAMVITGGAGPMTTIIHAN